MNLKIDVAISLIVGTSDPMTKNRSTKDTLRPSVRHDIVYSSVDLSRRAQDERARLYSHPFW